MHIVFFSLSEFFARFLSNVVAIPTKLLYALTILSVLHYPVTFILAFKATGDLSDALVQTMAVLNSVTLAAGCGYLT